MRRIDYATSHKFQRKAIYCGVIVIVWSGIFIITRVVDIPKGLLRDTIIPTSFLLVYLLGWQTCKYIGLHNQTQFLRELKKKI
jgi:hypothetical protein